MFLVTRRNHFWQTWRKTFDEKRNISGQCPKLTKKIKGKSSPWMAPMDMFSVLTTLLRSFWQKAENAPFSDRKWLKKWFFLWKVFFFKLFLWARKTQFWRPRGKFTEEKPKNFRSSFKKGQKVSKENVSFNWSNGQVECAFDKPGEKVLRKKQDSLVWKSESDKQKSTTFLQNLFNSKDSSAHVECSLDNPVQSSLTNCRRFVPQCLKKMIEKTFWKRKFFLKMFLWTVRMQFSQSRRKNCLT